MKKLLILSLSIFFFLSPLYANQAAALQENTAETIIAEFDAYAQRLQKEWNIPGMAVCVVIDGKITYKKSFGVKKVDTSDTVDEETVFQIGSCTKAFSAALVAKLADEGYLKWDDPVIKYLPDFALYDDSTTVNITVEDLLSQNSGLPSYSQHFMMLFGYDKDYILHSMRYIKPVGGFREKYGYQNNMFLLLGEVVESATGRTWAENVKKYILKPLKMKKTSTDYKSFLKNKNRSFGHYYAGGKLQYMPEDSSYGQWPYLFAAAGAVNTNINDISKWLLFITNEASAGKKKIISDENFNKLFEPKVYVNKNSFDTSKKNYYCMGWRYSEYYPQSYYWHGGATDGQGAYVSFLENRKVAIAVLMNLPNGRMADALTKKLYDLYLGNQKTNWSALQMKEAARSAKDKNLKTKPAKPSAHLELEKYAGNYHNILYGDAEIKLEDGKLKFSAGAKQTWITLKHFNAHSFDGTGVPGWSFKRPMFVFFVSKKSDVEGFIVENMTDGIEGVFKKVK
ncbi:serine hydrolase [Endomicrobium proavitum]|nr:serine hydrolase [Endomicrobium proavitum]